MKKRLNVEVRPLPSDSPPKTITSRFQSVKVGNKPLTHPLPKDNLVKGSK